MMEAGLRSAPLESSTDKLTFSGDFPTAVLTLAMSSMEVAHHLLTGDFAINWQNSF